MSEPEKNLTAAELQIQRLEKLRSQKEGESKASLEKTLSPAKTQAEQSMKKLKDLREKASKRPAKKKLDGKSKKIQLNALQTQVLEKLKTQDSRLNTSVVARIALNRFLDIENSFDENEIEARVFDILRQFNTKP